ncbi:DUF924 family protein [Oleisolibacter albus]|uniref:DUF924 family protein n=1 Tax=Oleisolibacter albus TaxID=2171757 RepID=UPI001EFD966D|nr:DUF924 family protein [Oleisolibacter albus]
MEADAAITRILRFWFEEAGPALWFNGGDAFDAQVTQVLAADHVRAVAGELDRWRDTAAGCLALCLLLDQAPRNMYRGTARAFASDFAALAVAEHAVARRFDLALAEVERVFLYLPFEHAESLEQQRRCVRLFAGRVADPSYLDFACRHLVIVERFGRFPHRNAILGRETTAEEAQFLALPGSGF